MRLGWQEQEGTRQQHTRVGMATTTNASCSQCKRWQKWTRSRLGLDSAHARTRREKLLPAFDSLTRGP
jgi:hypothetical protein